MIDLTDELSLDGDPSERPAKKRSARADRAESLARRLVHGRKAVIVGPWLGEVGFEVLYWIPFLRWLVTKQGLSPGRLIAVSRGGPRSWYRGIATRYIDLFDMVSPDDFRDWNIGRTGSVSRVKQGKDSTGFESRIIQTAADWFGVRNYDVLSPASVYGLIRPYYKGDVCSDAVREFMRHAPVRLRSLEDYSWLPPTFIAAKLYKSPVVPMARSQYESVERLITRLCDTTPVVLLDAGIRPDSHWDLPPFEHPQLSSITEHLTPSNNLEVQTQVLLRAELFIATYGGSTYLASMCGVPSVGLVARPDALEPPHVRYADEVSRLDGFGRIVVQPLDDAYIYQGVQDVRVSARLASLAAKRRA